jgi:hypothetical protein
MAPLEYAREASKTTGLVEKTVCLATRVTRDSASIWPSFKPETGERRERTSNNSSHQSRPRIDVAKNKKEFHG